jgi:hypothetical protein
MPSNSYAFSNSPVSSTARNGAFVLSLGMHGENISVWVRNELIDLGCIFGRASYSWFKSKNWMKLLNELVNVSSSRFLFMCYWGNDKIFFGYIGFDTMTKIDE